jgi:hypothetical protein
MQGNATGYLAHAGWSMDAYGTFENAATRTNYLAPFYLDGANVNSNYLNPFAQGTATTANGFVANSTSSFNPNLAAYQDITEGDDGWYVITYNDWTLDTLTPGERMTGNLNLGIITNTVDTQIQIVPFVVLPVTPAGKLTLTTNFQKDAQITYVANYIGYINNVVDLTSYVIGAGAVSLSGYCVRNMTAGSTIYFTNAAFTEKQNKV